MIILRNKVQMFSRKVRSEEAIELNTIQLVKELTLEGKMKVVKRPEHHPRMTRSQKWKRI